MSNARTKARIEARILERAAYCVQFELVDPRSAFITLTRASISDDLSTARIFYSVFGSQGDKAKVAHMLAGASGFIQRQVSRVLKLRRSPRLTWIFDDSIERGEAMDRLIGDALRHDREINPAAHVEAEVPEEESEEERIAREYQEFLAEQDEDGEVGPPADPANR